MLLWKQVKLNNTQETDTRKRNKLANTVLAGEMLSYIDLAILPFSSVLRYIAAGFLLLSSEILSPVDSTTSHTYMSNWEHV